MLLYILRFLLCLDIGYVKKSQEIKDVKELKDDLFKYAYCHLDIAFKKPEIISSEFESSDLMEIVGGDKAAKLVVNEWSREHFGMETLAIPRIFR